MSYEIRLKKKYFEQVVPALKEKFGYKNAMEVPRLVKIAINQGVGAAVSDKKLVDAAVDEMSKISGQKAQATFSRKAISNFKLRENMPIGARVTLRKEAMYDFIHRLNMTQRDVFFHIKYLADDYHQRLHHGKSRENGSSNEVRREDSCVPTRYYRSGKVEGYNRVYR